MICKQCSKEFVRNGSNRHAKCSSCRDGILPASRPIKLRNGVRICNTMETYDRPIFACPDGTYDTLRLTCKYSVETYVWNDVAGKWFFLKDGVLHHALMPEYYKGPYDIIKALKGDYEYAIAGKGSLRPEIIAEELKDYDIDASYDVITHKPTYRTSRGATPQVVTTTGD